LSALTLLISRREGQPICKNLLHLSPEFSLWEWLQKILQAKKQCVLMLND